MNFCDLSGEQIIVLSTIFAAYLAEDASSNEIRAMVVILSSIKDALVSMDIINCLPCDGKQ